MTKEAVAESATSTPAPKNVLEALSFIQEELCHLGISKARKNEKQNYKFRGIDDVYAALSPLLAKYRVLIFPSVKSHQITEFEGANGNALFRVIMSVTYKFVHVLSGSEKHIDIEVVGEAMDSGDKATNKAFSAAYKIAILQTFCVPVEGDDNDTENSDPEVRGNNQPTKQQTKQIEKDKFSVEAFVLPDGKFDLEQFSKDITSAFASSKNKGELDSYKASNVKMINHIKREDKLIFDKIAVAYAGNAKRLEAKSSNQEKEKGE